MRRQSKTEKLLIKALLEEGEMVEALYEYELLECVDDMKKSLKKDRDDYIFAVTHNNGHVAMVLIEKPDTVYINEAARERLQVAWQEAYTSNLKLLIPALAAGLDANEIMFNGVKVVG